MTDSAARVPFRRWVEVELHHVDLDVGYELEDLPAEFVEREIAFLAERFLGNQDVPATALTDLDGRTWSTGGGPAGRPGDGAGARRRAAGLALRPP